MLTDKLPLLALFDFGGTLFDDGKFNLSWAMRSLLDNALNPGVISEKELTALWEELNTAIRMNKTRNAGCGTDVTLASILRNITLRAGLKYDISLLELEIRFDRANSLRTPMPGTALLLGKLVARGIRTAVISNTVMSAAGMEAAIKELLPMAQPEFIITSADLVVCKPCTQLFEAAAKLAGVRPADCWYFGNDLNADVAGAAQAGMQPVYINELGPLPYCEREQNGVTYAAVNDWKEIAERI